jgi:transcriptional regulator with XRE-family HTH domain
MTVRELAERSGVNHSAISQIERGIREPRPATIRKLAEALDVKPEQLLRDDRP